MVRNIHPRSPKPAKETNTSKHTQDLSLCRRPVDSEVWFSTTTNLRYTVSKLLRLSGNDYNNIYDTFKHSRGAQNTKKLCSSLVCQSYEHTFSFTLSSLVILATTSGAQMTSWFIIVAMHKKDLSTVTEQWFLTLNLCLQVLWLAPTSMHIISAHLKYRTFYTKQTAKNGTRDSSTSGICIRANPPAYRMHSAKSSKSQLRSVWRKCKIRYVLLAS